MSVCTLTIHMYRFYAIMNFIQLTFIIPDARFIKTKKTESLPKEFVSSNRSEILS